MKWWTASFILILLLVYSSCNEQAIKRREKRFSLIVGVISNKTRNAIQKIGSLSAAGAEKLADVGAAVSKPLSSKVSKGFDKLGDKTSTAIETVGNVSANVAGKSVGAVETVAEKVVNYTFSHTEVQKLHKGFCHTMGLTYNENVDTNKMQSLLGEIFDPSTKLLDTDKTTCGLCKILIKKLQMNAFTVSKLGEVLCSVYILISTFTVTDFCKNIIEINKPIISYVVENSDILDPELACSILLRTKECNYPKPALQWTTSVSSTPPIIPKMNLLQVDPNEKPLTILHLSDFHITPDYSEESSSNCGYPMCCKKGLGNALLPKNAGRWGDYNCDIPPWLLGDTLRYLNSTYKDVSIVYFTGDIIDHTVWNTSKESNSKLIEYTYQALLETFPNAKVFSVIGNHESHPLNVFSPQHPDIDIKGLSSNWLYNLMAKVWQPWLPRESLETVRSQGYYAVSVNKRLKVIGLNNNVCYNFNWWLMYNTEYINEQLQFLNKELEMSEKIEQFVHILGHVSVGNQECIDPWETSYNAIIERFAHIIKGQFVGHTHTDELKIFYDKNQKPINMAYNGASLTPYLKYNPNYKVMYVQPTTMDILDIDTYYFNLTEANQNKNTSPVWRKLYSMKNAFNLNDLSPASFDIFAEKLLKDKSLQDLYWRYYVRLGDASLKDGCTGSCLDDVVCKVVTTRSFHSVKPKCDLI